MALLTRELETEVAYTNLSGETGRQGVLTRIWAIKRRVTDC